MFLENILNFSIRILAVLAAGAPHVAAFMADECLWAMPDIDSLDYTMKEYMRFSAAVDECVERLKSQGKNAAIFTFHDCSRR